MEIIIETCLKDLFIGLISENKLIDFILESDLVKKSDRLPFAFKKLLDRNMINVKKIESFYVTNGPGSFMGIRCGLIYASTIAQITKAKLKVINTLVFLSGGKKGKYYLDAKSNKTFFLDFPGEVKLIEGAYENSKINYEDFKNNIKNYLKLFKEIKAVDVKANYIKEPSVG